MEMGTGGFGPQMAKGPIRAIRCLGGTVKDRFAGSTRCLRTGEQFPPPAETDQRCLLPPYLFRRRQRQKFSLPGFRACPD